MESFHVLSSLDQMPEEGKQKMTKIFKTKIIMF